MISRLKGTVEEKTKERVVVDVAGVGYGLLVPETVLLRLPSIGGEVTLQVYTHVREDQLALFGFLTHLERDVFEILLSASGVGPKLAVGVLSALEAKQVLEAVAQNNKAVLTSIPGIGKKTVEKILIEIREKCEKRLMLERSGCADISGITIGAVGKKSSSVKDAGAIASAQSWAPDLEPALLALGYRDADVRLVVREILTRTEEMPSFEEAIKFALQCLSAGKSGTKQLRGNA